MSTPEYRKFRCCMCPNINISSIECPSRPLKEEVTFCRFVKTYIDERGWKYKVMGGIGESNYKARYQKPGKTGWKCMKNMEWRKTFDEAQSDLNALAEVKGWEEVRRVDLKSIKTNDLIKELEARKEIKRYDCGLYRKYEAQIKRKYSQDNGPVELPDSYKLLVISYS